MEGSSAFTLKRMFRKAAATRTPSNKAAAPRAEHKSDNQLPRALRHHHSENPSRIRSKRHSNSKFLCALAHRKTHHAVETDRGQNEGDAAENREQTHDDAIAGKTFVMQSSGCAGKINRHVRIKLSNRFFQRGTERFRALACARPNENRAKLRGRRCAQAAACRSRQISVC